MRLLKKHFSFSSENECYQNLFVALGFLVWFAATAFFRPLAVPDEGRYVGIAWEMLRSGNYLIPTLNGAPYFHKPPLFYWLTAASLAVFGQNELAARIAPMFGAWLGAFSLYLFMRRWSQPRLVSCVLLVLCVHPLYYLGAQYANMDMLVAGCITTTILLLAHTVLLIDQKLPYRYPLAAAYMMAGLGFLAKGLIGFILPALIIVIWLFVVRRLQILYRLLWLPGILLFSGIVAPWLLAMQRVFPHFFDYFFVTQHFNRFAKTGFNNALPFWFYLAILLIGSILWLPWLWSFFRRKLINIQNRQFSEPSKQIIDLLMVLWIVIITVFFSIPSSKLLGYIFPVLPPLAFLVGSGFADVERRSIFSRPLWWGAIFIALLINIVVVVLGKTYTPNSTKNLAKVFVSQVHKDEPIFMLNDYFFDFPFYAKLAHPVFVVNHWESAWMKARTDGQSRELMDTALFDPKHVSSTLIETDQWTSSLCAQKVSWVLGYKEEEINYPFLQVAQRVTSDSKMALWKIDISHTEMARALDCKRGEV